MSWRNTLGVRGVAIIVAAAASCSSPKEEAVKELDRRRIPVNGLSLRDAVEQGNLEEVGLLLRAGAYSGQRNGDGLTPLHVAIDRKHLDVAWALVDAGADIHARTPSEVTPLGVAMFRGQMSLVNHLMERGAEPDGLTPEGEGLLAWAIRNQKSELVPRLMASDVDLKQRDVEGSPLLHVAMNAGRRDLMEDLIELGADCAVLNGNRESTLVVALRNGWQDHAGLLVRRGADPNVPDRSGRTPFDEALRKKDLALAGKLLALGAVPSGGNLDKELARAYLRRSLDEASFLLRLGANPSPALRRCLLRRSAFDDETGFLHLFLGYSKVPEDMLYEYCRPGRSHIAYLLLAHGAGTNPGRAPFLDTPFARSVRQGSGRLVERLLEAGAHPDLPAIHRAPPLHVAIALGRASTVKRLLELGADPNQMISTPASEDFLRLVRGKTMRWLLRTDQRITPLMLAVDRGSLETAQVLLEHGAETNVWTRKAAIWPITIAGDHEDVKMMRLLLRKDPHVEERRVLVSLSKQRLWVFSASGKELFSCSVSTGKKGFRTPTGEFAITNRHRSWKSTIYESNMPFFQRLSCSDFGFHQGYVPNYPASHGCIRVPAGRASKLFKLTRLGDRVRIEP